MNDPKILDSLAGKLSALLAKTPVADLEKNARVFLNDAFSRLDLITREEFDIQKELLFRAQERVRILEARLNALENTGQKANPPPTDKT